MKHPPVRPGVAVAVVFVTLGALLLWRVASESSAELAAAHAYRQEDQLAPAVEHYRRAIRWSLPLSPNTAEAVSALESIAAQLEADGEVAGALLAWRSLAGGLAATRFLYSGSNPSRENASDQIARLMAMSRPIRGGERYSCWEWRCGLARWFFWRGAGSIRPAASVGPPPGVRFGAPS
jgi:hypothetical protein